MMKIIRKAFKYILESIPLVLCCFFARSEFNDLQIVYIVLIAAFYGFEINKEDKKKTKCKEIKCKACGKSYIKLTYEDDISPAFLSKCTIACICGQKYLFDELEESMVFINN